MVPLSLSTSKLFTWLWILECFSVFFFTSRSSVIKAHRNWILTQYKHVIGPYYTRPPDFFPKCLAHLDTPRCFNQFGAARLQFCRSTDESRYTPLVQLISILETAFSLFSNMFLGLSFILSFSHSSTRLPFFFSLSKQQTSSVRLTTCTSSQCFIRRRLLSRPVSLNPSISVISLIGNHSCDLQCLARHTCN